MPLDPIITVSIYPEQYMRIERHARNDDDRITETHVLSNSGEWISEYDGANVELPPIVAYYNDADSLRALIDRLQSYVDELEKMPHFEGIDYAT